MGAWIPSALVGLCFVNLPGQFVGPLGNLAEGIDISLPVTLGLASVVYLTLLRLFRNRLPSMARRTLAASALTRALHQRSNRPPDPKKDNRRPPSWLWIYSSYSSTPPACLCWLLRHAPRQDPRRLPGSRA
jgi:hypothetical protein